jgi:cytidyltransferase-like protein
MKKLTSITRLAAITSKSNQKTGLITGCFDILHIGHIELFRFAKKHVDILIVGLENDETIRMSKGQNRPIHNLSQRSEVLSELTSIDYLFTIPITVKFGAGQDIQKQYVDLVAKINPTYLITSPAADKYWTQKRDSLKPLGVKILKFQKTQNTSTTAVLSHLQSEL